MGDGNAPKIRERTGKTGRWGGLSGDFPRGRIGGVASMRGAAPLICDAARHVATKTLASGSHHDISLNRLIERILTPI